MLQEFNFDNFNPFFEQGEITIIEDEDISSFLEEKYQGLLGSQFSNLEKEIVKSKIDFKTFNTSLQEKFKDKDFRFKFHYFHFDLDIPNITKNAVEATIESILDTHYNNYLILIYSSNSSEISSLKIKKSSQVKILSKEVSLVDLFTIHIPLHLKNFFENYENYVKDVTENRILICNQLLEAIELGVTESFQLQDMNGNIFPCYVKLKKNSIDVESINFNNLFYLSKENGVINFHENTLTKKKNIYTENEVHELHDKCKNFHFNDLENLLGDLLANIKPNKNIELFNLEYFFMELNLISILRSLSTLNLNQLDKDFILMLFRDHKFNNKALLFSALLYEKNILSESIEEFRSKVSLYEKICDDEFVEKVGKKIKSVSYGLFLENNKTLEKKDYVLFDILHVSHLKGSFIGKIDSFLLPSPNCDTVQIIDYIDFENNYRKGTRLIIPIPIPFFYKKASKQ